MENSLPRLYATLNNRATHEARHLLLEPVDGARAVRLIQFTSGHETLLGDGNRYDMTEQADSLIARWTGEEGFRWVSERDRVYEPLAATIALALKLGFTYLYDPRLVRLGRLPINLTGVAALSDWRGMAGNNGGSYRYSLGAMSIYAVPSLPAGFPLVAPSGGLEFVAYMKKAIEAQKAVGPTAEFILGGERFSAL